MRKLEKNKFAFVQAEDELASIGMAIGANWNGARAFLQQPAALEFHS